jgi:hypothetical protein
VKHVGIDLFSEDVLATLNQFEEADNFGSLIIPATSNAGEVLRALSQKNMEGEMFLSETHEQIMTALTQADYLSQKYHVVVANPPYMTSSNFNSRIKRFSNDCFPQFNQDLYTLFVARIFAANPEFIGLMTPFTWMFLSSFEAFRTNIVKNKKIISLVRPEYHAFFESANVPLCCFIIQNRSDLDNKGVFFDLNDFTGAENQGVNVLLAISQKECNWKFTCSSRELLRLPSCPLAFWISDKTRELFEKKNSISKYSHIKQGLITGDNNKFLRNWTEVKFLNIGFGYSDSSLTTSKIHKWYPYTKGGPFRKWYGNREYIVDWEDNGSRIKNFTDYKGKQKSRPQNIQFYFKRAITWTSLTVGSFSGRYCEGGFIFDAKGPMIISKGMIDEKLLLGYLNSIVANYYFKFLAPTMDYSQGSVSQLPWIESNSTIKDRSSYLDTLIKLSKSDWDSYETSWDFTSLPLLDASYRGDTLAFTYKNLRAHWNEMTLEMKKLEEENNRIFIEAYGLEDELTPDVPLKEITLTCNPYYRYGDNKSNSELEELLLADTMKELISYAVGCMFGRYSIDKPGLILANQGETYEDYCRLVPDSTFSADVDNAIPVLDGDWFSDDIVMRFRKFLRVAFGEEKYEENLRFIEKALGKDLRQYFLKDFYNDHVRRYKKRPIYWMFSSPDGSFNVLIYMHRYRPDTASIVLNEYLREYQVKLSSYMESLRRKEANPDLSKGEKVKALKELDKLRKTQDILATYEREVLFPLANQRIEIDLDDGVKVNYPKFGAALKKVPGLEAKE